MTITTIRPLGPAYDRVPDDTEESIVGADYHQEAISTLSHGLRLCGLHRGLPWCVGNQLQMILPRHDARRPLILMPDILVHPTFGQNPQIDTLPLLTAGPPTLVMEVASRTTARRRDLGTKREIYAHLGIAEYLVFDPTQRFVSEVVAAWQLDDLGDYQPWQAAADERWHSSLGVSFQPDEWYLRVYAQDGQLLPTYWEAQQHRRLAEAAQREAEAQLAERDAQLAAAQQHAAALEAELRRLRGE